MKENLMKIFAGRVKERGFKMTGPREAIIKYLLENEGHHTMAEIYHNLRDMHSEIGIATAYRNVELFLELGILRVLTPRSDYPRYELNCPGDHHHHLICTACGIIIEFGRCNFSMISGEVEKVTGFIIEEHNLEAYGFCPRCQAARMNLFE